MQFLVPHFPPQMSCSLPYSRVARPQAPLPNASCMPFPGFTLLSFPFITLSSLVQYFQQEAVGKIAQWVKWFWMVESDSSDILTQKIIPDGYPEVIFHYGDPYEINITGNWERQSLSLLAGQAQKFFHLRNTGVTRMFAIKLQPWTLHALSETDASTLLDRVVPLHSSQVWSELRTIAITNQLLEEKCEIIGKLLSAQEFATPKVVQQALQRVLAANGLLTIQELIASLNVSERTLERHFKLHVGLSPKRYCRIIRHAYIFKVVNEKPDNWAQVAYKAGYYDQTHFIKNFQEFTGEDPSKYGFDDKTFANFFLK